MLKLSITALVITCLHIAKTQPLFSDNFENQQLSPAWKTINGNWHIADVQQMRIAPAEGGRQYVLRSDSAGMIRLFVEIPPSAKGKKMKLSFMYYTFGKTKGPSFETEFYKKEMIDGLRGRPTTTNLPVKGMWAPFTKTFTVPADANQFRVVFINPISSAKAPCFDVIAVSLP